MTLQTTTDLFYERVRNEFPPDFLGVDPRDLETYGRDWTRVFPAQPSAVVFPRTTEEVARFLRLCSEFKIAVVPSGGRTGLAGGAVASYGEIVLNLSKMNKIGEVDSVSEVLRVQAGAVTEAVHHHCQPHGLTWPVDFASKGSSQVGGNIATNAGGVKVIRYGLTREWVLGLQVVLMDGTVLELNGALEKNNTGLDLRQLFIGSEGILGVITEATLKLTKLPGEMDVFFFGVESVAAVLQLFHRARKAPFPIMAFEFLTQNCLDLVTEIRNVRSPFSAQYPVYVLFEVERPSNASLLDEWLASLFEDQVVMDGTLAQSPREAKDLWTLREGISESLSVKGFVYKNDIALPIAALDRFVPEMYEALLKDRAGLEVFLFGHIGDGNLHVNTMKPGGMSQEQFLEICAQADQDLFQLVQKYQGSISAEHGIGLLKKPYLHFSRSKAEIAAMHGIKNVFDPQGLMNPGKVLMSPDP